MIHSDLLVVHSEFKEFKTIPVEMGFQALALVKLPLGKLSNIGVIGLLSIHMLARQLNPVHILGVILRYYCD